MTDKSDVTRSTPAHSALKSDTALIETRFKPHERRDSAENGIDHEIQKLQATAAEPGGISGPSFRDNEFQVLPNTTSFPKIPYLRVNGLNNSSPSKALDNGRGAQLGVNWAVKTRSPVTASESGRSELSFLNIAKIYDRGTEAHMECESSRLRDSGVGNLPMEWLMPGCLQNGEDSTWPNAITSWPTQNDVQQSSELSIATSISLGTSIDVKSISDKICGSFELSAFDNRKYLPLDRLRQILSRNVVRQLLKQHFEEKEAARLEVEVLGAHCSGSNTTASPPKRRRILAILVVIEKLDKLLEFVKAGIDDTALPLTFDNKSNGGQLTKIFFSTRDPQNPLKLFGSWSHKDAHDFSQNQQIFYAPFFKFPGNEVSFYDLEHESTLPFCYYETHESGSYGSVRKAGIHHAHHNYSENNSVGHPCVSSYFSAHMRFAAYSKPGVDSDIWQ